MARVTLDYGASVPGTGPSVPFSIKADANKPPGDRRYKDYVPNPNAEKPQVKADDKISRKNFMRKPVVTSEVDYVSPSDASAKRSNDKEKIIAIAKGIYSEQAAKRKVYAEASKLLAEYKDDGETSLKEVERAEKIVQRGQPITKQQAMDKATAQFYGLKS